MTYTQSSTLASLQFGGWFRKKPKAEPEQDITIPAGGISPSAYSELSNHEKKLYQLHPSGKYYLQVIDGPHENTYNNLLDIDSELEMLRSCIWGGISEIEKQKAKEINLINLAKSRLIELNQLEAWELNNVELTERVQLHNILCAVQKKTGIPIFQ